MQTHETDRSASVRPPVPRPAASHDAAMLAAKVEALTAQVAYLVKRQKKQEELFSEMSPILKEVMGAATTQLDDLEKRGYFAFGREALRVGQRVVEGFRPEDVHAFGDAIVSILETVRTITQPEVLATMNEAAEVLEEADRVPPKGIVGMVRSTKDEDVQKGMAVMLEVLRHVGRTSRKFAERRAGSPTEQRRQKLAEALGPRRKKALGIERTPAPVASVVPIAAAAPAPAPAPVVEPSAWTPEIAKQLAAAEHLPLDDARFAIIELARRDFAETGVSPNIRRLTQLSSLATKELYALFPKAPARTIAKIAGIPKPAGCL